MTTEEAKRADIVEIGRRLHQRAYVASNDGNISVRLDAERLLTTPKSVSKGFMSPDMLVITDYAGRKLAGERGPVFGAADAPGRVPPPGRRHGRRSRPSPRRHGLRGGRHPARSGRAGRGG